MKKFKGRLFYTSWMNLPWKLIIDKDKIDLWPIIDKFLNSLNGKRANHKATYDSYELKADMTSEFRLDYISRSYARLEKIKEFGPSNVQAYLDTTLIRLSGRLVEIEIENGKRARIFANLSEKVFGVYFSDGNKACDILSDIEKSVCKAEQSDCCIFLLTGSNSFNCGKFDSHLAGLLLDRWTKGAIHGSIGNCALLGRKE